MLHLYVIYDKSLTPDYAEKIGADFYARDAKESVDIARKVLG